MDAAPGLLGKEILAALGLARDPFDDSAIDGLFYPGAGRQSCLEQLQHLLRFGDQILLLAGMEGSGRSSMRDALVRTAEQDVNICSFDAQVMRGSDSLLDDVLSAFGLSSDGDLKTVQAFCKFEHDAARLCWLLIDDAHQLAEQELRMLGELRQHCGATLHVALFGPASLEEQLHRRTAEGVEVYAVTLPALESDEIRNYIDYRFRTAGRSAGVPLTDVQCQLIAQQSRGNLVKLNVLACQHLAENVRRGPTPMAALPRSHLVLVSLMMMAVASLYLFNQEEQSTDARIAVPAISLDRHRVEVLGPPAGKDAGDSTRQSGPGTDQHTDQQQPRPELLAGSKPAPVGEGQNVAVAPAIAKPSSGPGAAVKAANSQLGAGASDDRSPIAVTAAAGADPKPAQSYIYGSNGRRGGEPDTDEAYLMRLAGSTWTVQLMASHDAARIASFRQQYSLDTRRFRKLRNGKDWFVVVYGSFANRDQASAAVSKLPSRLRRMQPWVRSTADVQREIREARALL